MIFHVIEKIKNFVWPPSVMDGAPYLSTYYFTPTKPLMGTDRCPLWWKFREYIGKDYVAVLTLNDRAERCYGFIGFFHYLHRIAGTTLFICWNKDPLNGVNEAPTLVMHLYDIRDLHPIEHWENLVQSLKKGQPKYNFGIPKAIVHIPLVPQQGGVQSFEFPDSFKQISAFFVVVNVPGLYPAGTTYHDTTLLELIPGEKTIRWYPQDWFNKGNFDFGYEWITRAVRHPSTNHIHGQGIRMGNFILNPDGRTKGVDV